MPCRYIREEYLTSDRVDQLDVKAERFYFRLFLVVDDFGRFEANEKLLKSKVFPLKDDIRATDIARWLTACEMAGLIRLYTVDCKRYLSVDRFAQTRANCRSSRSKYPDPPAENNSVQQLANNLQANANNLQALAADNDNENESDNENENEYTAPARGKCVSSFKLTQYPQSADDVLAICAAIKSPMTESQAQAYIDWHIRSDWHQGVGGNGRKIKIEAIPADIRLWIDRIKAEEARQAQQAQAKNASNNRQTGILAQEPVYSSNERGNNNAGNR